MQLKNIQYFNVFIYKYVIIISKTTENVQWVMLKSTLKIRMEQFDEDYSFEDFDATKNDLTQAV